MYGIETKGETMATQLKNLGLYTLTAIGIVTAVLGLPATLLFT